MNISFNWLKSYLEKEDLNPQDVALQLSLKGANVEGVAEKDADFVFDIENKSITHRPDLFCHYGLAREVSAIYRTELKELDVKKFEINEENVKLSIKNQEPDLCNRYIGVEIENMTITESPEWLKAKLESIGENSINNIVDLTNYVMFELGQPMHAFDKSKINSSEATIIIRKAKEGEKLLTLDEKELELTSVDLVIADSEKPIALAGVKGGKSSEVDQRTKSIILEAANFDGPGVRKTSLRHVLRTEASSRFEKRLDPNLCLLAVERFVELLPKVGCEKAKVVSSCDEYLTPKRSWDVSVDLKRLPIFAGDKIPFDRIKNILRSLHLEIIKSSANELVLRIPTWRDDLHIEEDIYEEIMRVYGFENIKPKPLHGEIKTPSWPAEIDHIDMLKDNLTALGYDELWVHSFTNEKTIEKAGLSLENHVRVKNALSKEVEFLRTSLVPELLNKVKLNFARFSKFKIFSIDKVYHIISQGSERKDKPARVEEPRSICFMNYSKESEEFSILDSKILHIKNDIEQLLSSANETVEFAPAKITPSYFNSENCTEIILGNVVVGYMGEIDQKTQENFKIAGEVYIAELNLAMISEYRVDHPEVNVRFQPINPYPVVQRDISFWIEADSTWSEIKAAIQDHRSEIFQQVELFDIFQDTEKNGNKKSIALSLIFQSDQKTLTDEEVDIEVEKITSILKEKYKIKLRDK